MQKRLLMVVLDYTDTENVIALARVVRLLECVDEVIIAGRNEEEASRHEEWITPEKAMEEVGKLCGA